MTISSHGVFDFCTKLLARNYHREREPLIKKGLIK